MTYDFRTDFNFGSEMMPGIDLAGKYFNETQEIPNTGGIPDAGDMTPSSDPMNVTGLGPRGRKVIELQNQGYSFEDAVKLANLDTTDSDTDDRLFDFLERQTDPDRLSQTLALKNEFERQRLAQAAPYNFMYQIPKTLAQAAVLPATVALGSAKTATDALARIGGANLGGGAINTNQTYF